MGKTIKTILILVVCSTLCAGNAQAQLPILDVIATATKKVIRQIDLKVQKLQNKTIWLQNAQKVLENKMSALKLDEISGWAGKQKELFRGYYEELAKVKAVIGTYNKVRQIVSQQLQIVEEYRFAYNTVKQDGHFSPSEVGYIYKVYTGIIDESLRNLDELYMVVSPAATQMTDAQRLERISYVAANMQSSLDNLRRFNSRNRQVSIQRAKAGMEADATKRIYGVK